MADSQWIASLVFVHKAFWIFRLLFSQSQFIYVTQYASLFFAVKHTVKKLPRSQVLITIELEPTELDRFRGKALDKLRAQVNIPGFRQGKAPDESVVQHVGADKLLEETLQTALPEFYYEIVMQEKLQPITGPEMKVVTDQPLVLELTVNLLPEVKVGNYKKIQVKKTEIEVSEKDIENEIEVLKKNFVTYNEVQAPAQDGYRVEINFVGTADGKEVDGAKSTNHPLILGSNTFIPGFEENLIGLSAGDKKQFVLTFPADYHVETLKAKPVTFDIEVLKVEETKNPVMDDEFYKKLKNPKITDEASLKEEIRSFIKSQKELEGQNRCEEEILKQLIAVTEVDLPELLIDEEIHYMEEQFAERLQSVGLTMEKYLESNGKTHADIHTEYGPEAQKRLTARFALLELAKLENLEPTDDQAKDYLRKEGVAENDLEKRIPQMKARMRVELSLDYLLKSAVK